MKSLIQTIIITSLIGLISFTAFSKQASNNNNRSVVLQNKQIVISFSVPQYTNEGHIKHYARNILFNKSVNAQNNQITKSSLAERTCPNNKINQVYELTAMFNDKLQLLLSFFASPDNEFTIEDDIKDKESLQVVSRNKVLNKAI